MLHLDVQSDTVVALALVVAVRTTELRRSAALQAHVALQVVQLRVGLEALRTDVALPGTVCGQDECESVGWANRGLKEIWEGD